MKNSNVKTTKRRNFGGKTSGFASNEERDFEQKHLKAYIKGKSFFRHRFKTIIEDVMGVEVERRVPAWFDTKVNWV